MNISIKEIESKGFTFAGESGKNKHVKSFYGNLDNITYYSALDKVEITNYHDSILFHGTVINIEELSTVLKMVRI